MSPTSSAVECAACCPNNGQRGRGVIWGAGGVCFISTFSLNVALLSFSSVRSSALSFVSPATHVLHIIQVSFFLQLCNNFIFIFSKYHYRYMPNRSLLYPPQTVTIQLWKCGFSVVGINNRSCSEWYVGSVVYIRNQGTLESATVPLLFVTLTWTSQ